MIDSTNKTSSSAASIGLWFMHRAHCAPISRTTVRSWKLTKCHNELEMCLGFLDLQKCSGQTPGNLSVKMLQYCTQAETTDTYQRMCKMQTYY